MRWVICAVVVLAFAPGAFAQDVDILRGSQPVGPATFTRWSGFYLGGQFGVTDGDANFTNSTQAPIAYVLRSSTLENNSHPSQMPVLGTADHTAPSYGGFVGYNTQWQDLILGLEGNYSHTSLALNAPSSPIQRSNFSDGGGNTYTVGIDAIGTVTDLNFGSWRARAGWVLGNFLPYGFAGFALGVADINVTAGVSGTCDAGSKPTCAPFAFTASAGSSSTLLYGFTVGGGMDVALTPNVFLRGEFEYIRFAPVFNVPIALSSARVGAGIKF